MTVITYSHTSKWGSTYWKCVCECGNVKNISKSNLKYNTKSCGCIRTKPHTALKRIYKSYQNKAKDRNLEFSISIDFFEKLINSNCHYCGSDKTNIMKCKNRVYFYNGIDRKDSTLGYLVNNCVTCCKKCNTAKLDYSKDEFETWINNLVQYRLKNYPELYLGEYSV